MTAGESAFSTGWTRKTHGASASRSLSSCPGRPSALRWIPSRSAVVYWPAVRSSWPTRKQGRETPPSRGAEDSLLTDDELFDAAHDQRPEVFRRLGDKVALRFPDPEQRADAAGRAIPHEFVLNGPEANGISSLEEGRERIWTLVVEEYAEVWDAAEPPVVQS